MYFIVKKITNNNNNNNNNNCNCGHKKQLTQEQ